MATAKRKGTKAALRGHRSNPALWVVSNPPGPRSETNAWRAVQDIARGLIELNVAAGVNGRARQLIKIADVMIAQVKSGIHKNPGSAGSAGRAAGEKFSGHVQAIVYEHVTEGPRVHGFGNADPDLKTRGRTLSMTGLHERTGAAMYAMPDGSILIRNTNGKPLWRRDR